MSAAARWFALVPTRIGKVMGMPIAFVANCIIILVWAIAGPFFGFSDTWQLVVNTGTTVFTYLLLFIIQNTQNRDSEAIHLKLDELIRAVGPARTEMALAGLENAPDADLRAARTELERLVERASRAEGGEERTQNAGR